MHADHLSPAELESYTAQTLPAESLAEASDHLAQCAACREQLSRVRASALPNETSTGRGFGEEVADDADGFAPWVLPAAAGIALGVGAVWWLVTLHQEAKPFVQLRDNTQTLAINQDGDAPAFLNLPPPLHQAVTEALRSGRVAMPAEIETLASGSSKSNALQLLAPIATAVRADRPQFSWTAWPDATGYKLTIAELTSGALLRSQDFSPNETNWQPAEPLPREQDYRWQVQALRGAEVIAQSAEGRFRVLPVGKEAELEEWERFAGDSHLVRGVVRARAGLRAEAAEEFAALVRQNPQSSIARRLLEQMTQPLPSSSR